jgi:hypothetical protein
VIIPKDRDLLKFCSYLDSQSEYQLSDAIQNKIASKYGNVRVASTNKNLGEYSTLVFQLADHFIKYSQTHGLIKTSDIDIPDHIRRTMERMEELDFRDDPAGRRTPSDVPPSPRRLELDDTPRPMDTPRPRDTPRDTPPRPDTPAPRPAPSDTPAPKPLDTPPVPKDKKLTPSILKKFFSNLNLPGWLLKILNSKTMQILGIVGTIAGAGFLIYDIATQGFAEAVDTPQEKAIFAAVITDLAAWASLIIPPPVGPVAFAILNGLSLGAGVLSWMLPDNEDETPKPAQKPSEQKPSEENQDKPGAKPLGDSTNNLLYEAIVDVTGTSQIRVKNLIKFKAEIEEKIDRLSKMYPGSSAESAKQKLNASIAKWNTAK